MTTVMIHVDKVVYCRETVQVTSLVKESQQITEDW